MSHVSGIKFSPEQMNKLKNAMSRASQPGGASIAELQDELLGFSRHEFGEGHIFTGR